MANQKRNRIQILKELLEAYIENGTENPTEDEDNEYPKTGEASYIIGDYSQYILYCSYNDNDVFDLLTSGELNEYCFNSESGMDLRHVGYKPSDGDYEKILIDSLIKCGGWPSDYGPSKPVPMIEYIESRGPRYSHAMRKALDLIKPGLREEYERIKELDVATSDARAHLRTFIKGQTLPFIELPEEDLI